MGAKHFPTRSSYESTHLEFATLKKCVVCLVFGESHVSSETHMGNIEIEIKEANTNKTNASTKCPELLPHRSSKAS